MGYPQPPAPPAPASRPTTVTAAAFAMFALGALQVLSIPLALTVLGPTHDAVRDALGNEPNADSIATASTFGIYFGVGIAAVFAIGWFLLGMFNLRGAQPARVVAWVVSGLFLCCVSLSLATSAITNSMGGSGSTVNGVSQAELQRRIEAAQPSYYRPLSITMFIVEAILVLGVIVLLALPASNEYFRKPANPAWEPPLPGQPYPPA